MLYAHGDMIACENESSSFGFCLDIRNALVVATYSFRLSSGVRAIKLKILTEPKRFPVVSWLVKNSPTCLVFFFRSRTDSSQALDTVDFWAQPGNVFKI